MLGDRCAERIDETSVTGEFVGPVEDHRDRGPRGVRAAARGGREAVHAVGGRGLGRGEALAGQQHRVGQERRELTQVGGAALAQVAERLGGHPGRNGRGRHEFRVGHRLAAQRDQRNPGGAQRGDTPGPRLAPASRRSTAMSAPSVSAARAPGSSGEIIIYLTKIK